MAVELFSAQTGIVLDAQDLLVISTRNSLPGVVVSIEARVMGLDGRISHHRFDHTPNSDKTAHSSTFRLGSGLLVGIGVATTTGKPKRGETFVCLFLSRDSSSPSNLMVPLVADYVVSGVALGWPGAPLRSSIEGRGRMKSLQGNSPGAGNNILFIVPAGVSWTIIALEATLNTDATVIDRTPSFYFNSGVVQIFSWKPGTSVPASSSVSYTLNGVTDQDFNSLNGVSANLNPIRLSAGSMIFSSTNNIQPADSYFSPVLYFEEFIEG